MESNSERVHPIRAARLKRGMSQAGLAKAVGVSKVAVSKWENGAAQPVPATAKRLCSTLQLRLEEVFAEVAA